jgi:hypothetical protein
VQYSTAVRDAQNNAMAATIGAAPVLEIRSGAKPSNCAEPDTGEVLAVGTLPSTWLATSASGMTANVEPWRLIGQIGAGMGKRGEYFRIKQGGDCHLQGTFGEAGEMQPDGPNQISNGKLVTVSLFTVTRGNA